MERAFVCNQTPGRDRQCPVLPSGALGSSRREAPSGLAAETVRPRSEDVLCDLRRALWVQTQTSPRGFSAPRGRRGLSNPWRQSLPFLFLETREAATWKERRESPHGAAQVRGGGAQGTLRARTADRKPGDNPFPSTCSWGTSSRGNPPSRSQPGEQRVWEARSGSESGGGGTQEGWRWGQGRAPACTSFPGRMTESSTQLAPR